MKQGDNRVTLDFQCINSTGGWYSLGTKDSHAVSLSQFHRITQTYSHLQFKGKVQPKHYLRVFIRTYNLYLKAVKAESINIVIPVFCPEQEVVEQRCLIYFSPI